MPCVTGVQAHVCSVDGVRPAAAVGDDQLRRACFGIVRVVIFAINCAHSDAIDAICITIKVAVIPAAGTVTRREDEDGSLTIPSLLHPVNHCSLDKNTGSLHGLAVVDGAPR